MMIRHPELSLEEREEKLKNECNKREMRNYSHSLQQSEIDEETRNYAQDATDLKSQEEQLDNIKKEYAQKIKNINDRMDERLEKIKFGKKTVSGFLYGIADHPNQRMMFYDKFGELVDSRDLLPDERQGKLFIHSQAPVEDLPLGGLEEKKPGQSEEDEKIAKDMKLQFTPVSKEDPRFNMPANSDGGNGDEGGNAGQQAQEELDVDMPLTIEQLKFAATKRDLTANEQELLQKLNADEKNKKRREADKKRRGNK